jgi:hypothetical protein
MAIETMKTADEFKAWEDGLGHWDNWTAEQRDERKRLFKTLPAAERYRAQRISTEEYFTDERRGEVRHEEVSPSGRYRLTVTPYETKKGSWSYTRGEVYRVSDGVKVGDVKRNYGCFPYCWMEDHVDGHDYLICGEDYQGQTFCQLDTGEQKSLIPDDAFEGFGFCWAGYRLLEDGKTLEVDGCYWACPYELRLYDVSDPMNGWPLLEIEKEGEEENERASFEPHNATLTYQNGLFLWEKRSRVFKATGERESVIESRQYAALREVSDAKTLGKPQEEIDALQGKLDALYAAYPDEDEDEDKWDSIPEHQVTLRRKSNGLLVVEEEWKSDYILEDERKREEYRAKSKAERKAWLEADPLYAVLGEDLDDIQPLTGFLIPSHNARIKGDPNPCYITISGRVFDPDKSYNHTVTVKWGVEDGPVIVEKWVRGQGNLKDQPTYPRTPDGIRAAWAAGQAHLAAEGRA